MGNPSTRKQRKNPAKATQKAQQLERKSSQQREALVDKRMKNDGYRTIRTEVKIKEFLINEVQKNPQLLKKNPELIQKIKNSKMPDVLGIGSGRRYAFGDGKGSTVESLVRQYKAGTDVLVEVLGPKEVRHMEYYVQFKEDTDWRRIGGSQDRNTTVIQNKLWDVTENKPRRVGIEIIDPKTGKAIERKGIVRVYGGSISPPSDVESSRLTPPSSKTTSSGKAVTGGRSAGKPIGSEAISDQKVFSKSTGGDSSATTHRYSGPQTQTATTPQKVSRLGRVSKNLSSALKRIGFNKYNFSKILKGILSPTFIATVGGFFSLVKGLDDINNALATISGEGSILRGEIQRIRQIKLQFEEMFNEYNECTQHLHEANIDTILSIGVGSSEGISMMKEIARNKLPELRKKYRLLSYQWIRKIRKYNESVDRRIDYANKIWNNTSILVAQEMFGGGAYKIYLARQDLYKIRGEIRDAAKFLIRTTELMREDIMLLENYLGSKR